VSVLLGVYLGKKYDLIKWKQGIKLNGFVKVNQQELLYMLKESSDKRFKARKVRNYYKLLEE